MRDLTPWLGFCHIRKETDDPRSSRKTLVAVWTDSIEGFEREVHFHTNTHGLQMIGTEEVQPAADWLAKYPDRKDGQRLATKVSAKHPVALAGFRAGETSAGGPPDDTEGYLHIEEIEGVEPLDSQFGVHPPKTVPDALYEPLFGQPAPTPAEVAQYGGAEKVPPLHTYAILDAAKVVNFVEMLEASGLEHRCLFKGEAAQEMRDVAPYLVRLEEDNDFTRNLFSHDPEQEVPWFMWAREPGVYVRSRGTLEEMWKHFRKFTKVQDEDGKWFYFRFWEASVIPQFLRELGASQRQRFQGIFCGIDELALFNVVFIHAQKSTYDVINGSVARAGSNNMHVSKITIEPNDLTQFAKVMQSGFLLKLRQDMKRLALGHYKMSEKGFASYCDKTIKRAADYRMVTEEDVAFFVHTSFEHGISFWDKPDVIAITNDKNLQTSGMVMNAVKHHLEKGNLQ